MKGLILNGTNNFFNVEGEDGIVRHCSIKGKILKNAEGYYNPLAPGDFVVIEPQEGNGGRILGLLDRKNRFVRRNTKLNSPQLLAANIDLLLCITTPKNPPFRPRFVDRVLVQADFEKIPVLIVVNKTDLKAYSGISERIENWRKIGYEAVEVSAKTKDGIDSLIKRIGGLTVVAAGQSGVGKSSLINAIAPELNLKTAEISYKYDRGSHTTTQGNFFKITAKTSAGEEHKIGIIDTPGIRSFCVWGIGAGEVQFYFRELKPLAGKCKFALSCTHKKEKGCKVLEALEKGGIIRDRYESWLSIKEEISEFTKGEY